MVWKSKIQRIDPVDSSAEREALSPPGSIINRRRAALVVASFASLITGIAHASDDEYFYLLDSRPTTRYESPDKACQVSYEINVPLIIRQYSGPNSSVTVQPYQPPFRSSESTESNVWYYCQTYFDVNVKGHISVLHWDSFIQQKRNGCPNGGVLNTLTESCEYPNEEQARKELGDPSRPILGGV